MSQKIQRLKWEKFTKMAGSRQRGSSPIWERSGPCIAYPSLSGGRAWAEAAGCGWGVPSLLALRGSCASALLIAMCTWLEPLHHLFRFAGWCACVGGDALIRSLDCSTHRASGRDRSWHTYCYVVSLQCEAGTERKVSTEASLLSQG